MNNLNIFAATTTSGISVEFLAGVGGLGWLLTVYCLWDKFDSKKDKAIHLVTDIVNATFAVITLVAAVSLAISLSITLPDAISNRVAKEIRDSAPAKSPEIPPVVVSLTLADELFKLSRARKLDDTSLNEVLRRQLKGLSYAEGSLSVVVGSNQFRISKNLVGNVTR
jgi:hypothetical protein